MTPHESLTEFDIGRSRSSLRRIQKIVVRRALLRGVDAVVVASRLELQDSIRPGEPGVVIAHPVPAQAVLKRPSASRVQLGFLGRLHPKKRVEMLLEALVGVPGTDLIIGGDQPPQELDRLGRRASDLGLRDRVTFLGYVDADARPRFFSNIDLLVMPSDYECFGMVAAEAMSCGRPAVVTERTGVADTVLRHQAGLVIRVTHTAALRDALQVAVSKLQERNDWGDAARRAASEEFSFDAYARGIFDVYERVTKGR